MADVGVRFIIEAENRAAAELAKARDALKGVKDTGNDASQTLSQLTTVSRTFVGQITGAINPALGGMSLGLTNVAKGAGAMGAAVGAAAAALVIAGAAGAKYIETLDQIALKQAQMNIAARGFDVAAIRSSMQAAALEIEQMAVRGQSAIGRMMNSLRTWTDWMGLTASATADLARAQEAMEKTIPIERTRLMTEALLAQRQALVQLRQLEMSRAENLGDVGGYGAALSGVRGGLSSAFTLEERQIRTNADMAIGLAQARGAPASEIQALRAKRDADIDAVAARALVAFGTTDEAARRFYAGRFDRDLALDITAAAAGEQAGVGPTPMELVQGYAGRRARTLEGLTAGRDAAQLYTGIYGLSPQQQDRLSLNLIEAERARAVEEQYRDPARQDIENLRAQIATSNVLTAGGERDSASLGLARGFRDAATEAEQSGRIMQEFARNTARGMQQAFSDNFFAVITGDFKRLPELAKSFGLAMVRNITDALAQAATAPILRAFAGGGVPNGGGIRSVALAGASALTGGLPAGTVVTGAAGAPLVTGSFPSAAAGTATGGVGGSLPVGSLLQLLPKPGGLTNLLNTPVSSLFNGSAFTYGLEAAATAGSINAAGANIAYTAADVATLQAAGYSAADIALLAGGAEAASAGTSVGAASAANAAGLTIGSALGVIGGVVGFGFSLYSAYQSGSPAYGAASGALSGALLGATIGSIFPGIGTAIGAIVGAVVGAAAGAGAGAAGKSGKSGAQREADEAKDAIALANNLVIAVNQAGSVDEILVLLGQYQSGYIGGLQGDPRVAVVTTVMVDGKRKYPVAPSTYKKLASTAIYPLASKDEFLLNIDTLQASIQAGVSPGLLQGPNQAIADAIKAKVKRIAAIEGKTLFGFRERFAAPGVPAGPGAPAAVERETFLPLGRVNEAEGQDLYVNADAFRAAGLSDNEAEMVLRRLARVDRDRALGYFPVERFLF